MAHKEYKKLLIVDYIMANGVRRTDSFAVIPRSDRNKEMQARLECDRICRKHNYKKWEYRTELIPSFL